MTCARCGARGAGLVSVAELDEGHAAVVVAEVPLCLEHLAEVAPVLGFERPGALRREPAARAAP